MRRCKNCSFTYSEGKKKHVYGMIYFQTCQKDQPKGHLCYMQPIQLSEALETCPDYIFFNFESRVDELNGRHILNYAVNHKVCELCIDVEEIGTPCEHERQVIFSDDDTIEDFCKWAQTRFSWHTT
ncbi:hypothetical protein HOLleu_02325 [Holothuria leucospilota]|uniref:Uncharacterized protein n=1 Tax=Holothuria leucospilota TaxID=206669 RepID=A0A9Q1CR54_HOLLE|nr:hypothetical protein HOLleu_02325 [Holothuria leucospilota]